jgi:hypothetical protein
MSEYAEFYAPGTFDPTEGEVANEYSLHQGGLDQIDPAYDATHQNLLAGVLGFDPADVYAPSLDTELTIEKELPQWGPPFVKFVDGRISELEKKVEAAIEKWQFQTQTVVFGSSAQTTAAGGLDQVTTPNCIFLSSDPGWTFAIHRFEVTVPGTAFNFATPFNGAGAYWELRVNNEARDGGSLVLNAPQRAFGLPFIIAYGTRDAIRVRDGEIASLFLSAGPASTKIQIKCQASMDRTIEG